MERIVEQVHSAIPLKEQRKRVAAYARVSSGKDAMLHSLSAQVSYYNDLIHSRSDWLYCGVYSDEAVTGTKIERKGFQALLSDCRAGKLDMVIVKSISRLARNTVTLLETVRELKCLGVDVFFEEQNIHTMSADGELMLTILASYAQEESLSVSENQKWRVRKNFSEGKPWGCTILGYRNQNGSFVVVPEEAEIVKRIFRLYLDGAGVQTIVSILNAEGLRTRNGNEFYTCGVAKVLRNYTYTGNLLLQKTFRENHLTKKKCVNHGELPKYHAVDTHEAIIDIDTFNRVQEEIKRRAEKFTPRPKPEQPYRFTSLIKCANCGKNYRRKMTATGPVWICSTYNTKGKAVCAAKQIPETTLETVTADIDINRLDSITAANDNRLFFHFKDGAVEERRWKERSRSESWTPEMRKKAGDLRRKKQWQEM